MTGFYVIEAAVAFGFADPVGPADQGWLAQPWLANAQVEAVPAGTTTIYASDTGYRTLATDAMGVRAYPPSVIDAFQVDVSVNLDPTRSAIGAAWGSLTLANVDHAYDSYIANYQSDGQPITIYRGEKTLDPDRGIAVDPPYASLVRVFTGVMGPWQPQLNQVTVALQDAAYFLDKPIARTFYGGTGNADGTASLNGVAKPIVYGGGTSVAINVPNITPLSIDPANLIYQVSAKGGIINAVFDGGIALTKDSPVATVYAGTPPASGHFRGDSAGLLQIGSAPVYALTADVWVPIGTQRGKLQEMALWASLELAAVPSGMVGGFGSGGNLMEAYAADATQAAVALAALSGIYIASGDSPNGMTILSQLLAPGGVLMVPGRDGKLRLMVLTTIPDGSVPVVSLDDTTIVSINRIALPTTVDPPPWRMRLAYGRNWTTQQATQLSGVGATPTQATFAANPYRSVIGVGSTQAGVSVRLNDPDVIGASGGSMDRTATAAQTIVNNMVALWGVQRYLYEITVPRSVGLALDWASIVNVTSAFGGLEAPGKLGQIVGWAYSSGEPTSKFRVLV